MKKTAIAIFIGITFLGCSDKRAQKDSALDEVIKVHNKVMSADERLMKNKMMLDTLLQKSDLPGRDTATMLRTNLVLADSAMETWMHKFDPDYKGKSDDETIAYLYAQKKQIASIDSQLNKSISESDKFLSKIKAK
ncbi:MAG: hypothetical protein JWP94_2400 [Mucilaginibacter sp.]|nr:hypothetical protein [Mucilaginibacter sp.]